MRATERFPDGQEAIRAAQDGHQARIWTSLPGIFVDFDPVRVTATVQPAVQGIVTDQAGQPRNVNIPLLKDVPVVFPRGGGGMVTFPIQPGDECLVSFASRCIDGWWQAGGIQKQLEARMHDLSDGFAIPGPFSQAQAAKIGPVSTSEIQMRNDAGDTLLALQPSGKIIRLVAPGGIQIEGSLNCTGIITSNDDVIGGGISLKSHLTGGIQAGSDISGPPEKSQ